MINQRRINTFVVCGLLVVVGAMTIGFAALSQRLDINGTATVKSASSSWNVYFSNVNTTGGLVGTGAWSTAPSVSTDTTNTGSNNKITFACALAAPGDSCTVTVTIKNGGTTKALYNGFTLKVDSKNESGNTVTLSDGTIITITPQSDWVIGTTNVEKDQTGEFVIKMELPSTVTSLPSTDTEHTIEMSLNFTQATS